jgi:hypothetical protein
MKYVIRVVRFTALVLTPCALAIPVQGCGALLLGYIVGSEIDKSKAVEQCRNNLNNTNAARVARHEEPFPDQCSR